MIVIPLSKTKSVLLILGCAAFVACGIWMFGLDAVEIESHRRFNSPIFVHSIGLSAIVLGSLVLAAMIRKLITNSPGLIVDERGITDNSSAFSAGFVPWSSVDGLDVGAVQGQRLLYVRLKDPAAYVASCTPLKRFVLSGNLKMGLSPVAITSVPLAIGFDELVALVNRQFESHGSNA